MSDISEIMREFDAILAYAVHIKSLRNELKNFFKKDFLDILSPSFNVIPIIEEDLTEDGKSLPSHKDLLPYIFDDPKPSDYFYVFNSHSKIDYRYRLRHGEYVNSSSVLFLCVREKVRYFHARTSFLCSECVNSRVSKLQ